MYLVAPLVEALGNYINGMQRTAGNSVPMSRTEFDEMAVDGTRNCEDSNILVAPLAEAWGNYPQNAVNGGEQRR